MHRAAGIGGVKKREGIEALLGKTVNQTAQQIQAVVGSGLHGGGLRQQHQDVEVYLLNAGGGDDASRIGGIFRNGRKIGGNIFTRGTLMNGFNREDGSSGGCRLGSKSCKLLADELLDTGGIDVAHHGHRHQFRTVPLLVILAYGLRCGMADDGGVADGDALRIERAIEQLHDQRHLMVGLGTAALQALGEDNATLLLHLVGTDQQTVGPVGQNGERSVDQQRVGGRQLQLVDGFSERCMGIKVFAELGTARLQEADDAVAGEMARAVEGQVLQEMCQPLLVVTLVDAAGLDKQAVDSLALGRLVGVDIIGKPIVELPHP